MFKAYLEALKNIFFPRLCFYCSKKIEKGYLCPACTNQITSAKIEPRPKDAPYDELLCAVEYHEPIVTLIHKFKYQHYRWLAEPLAGMISDKLSRYKINADLITCVPSHPAKIKERGYNPPAELAKKLAKNFNIPFIDDIIYEHSYRRSQTKIAKEKRADNVNSAFGAKDGYAGKAVILVDDVYTTGATITDCARALKEKGVTKIIAVTLAKSL